MSGPLRVERDVSVGRWLQDALVFEANVRSVVPPIFDAYVRVQHPALLHVPTGGADAWGNPETTPREITWDEAAALVGELPQPGGYTAWLARFGDGELVAREGATHRGDPVGGAHVTDPHSGDVPLDVLAALAGHVLAEHGDAEVLAAAWEGSGFDPGGTALFAWFPDEIPPAERERLQREEQARYRAARLASIDPEILDAMQRGQVLGLPAGGGGRGHVLLRGRLATFAEPGWQLAAGLGWRADEGVLGAGRTPNAIWPVEPHAHPAWMLHCDLDLDVTHVGGTPALIARILADESLDAHLMRPADPLT